jgi:hypothetical protein
VGYCRKLGGLLLVGSALSVAQADWKLSSPGDPSRNWAINFGSSVGYDDNINTSSAKREGSVTSTFEPQISVRIPMEQTAVRMRYLYRAVYYGDRPGGEIDESHVVDLSMNHAFSPRLAGNLNESFRRGIEPELVENSSITRRSSDYYFNNLSGGLNYQFSPRWSAGLNPSWEMLRYDDPDRAEDNDRDSFSSTLTANFSMFPRIFVGGNYRFGFTDYVGGDQTNQARDVDSHSLYASVVYRYKPQVVIQSSAGASLAGFADDSSDVSPYFILIGSYNVGFKTTISGGITYSIALAEVSQYRSSNQTTWYLNLRHQFTPKFQVGLDFSYIMSQLENLNPLSKSPFPGITPSSVEEDSWRIGVNCRYEFTRWAGLTLNYNFDQLDSSLPGRSFDRNRFNAGLRLSY